MENSALFATVLRSLGYRVLSTGARVHGGMNPNGENAYSGWSHMVNLVQFGDDDETSNKRIFFVDVGFGSACPTRPVELTNLHSDDPSLATQNTEWLNVPPYQYSRIRYDTIEDNSTSFSTTTSNTQKMYIYEIKLPKADPKDSKWQPAYCFSDLEFLPADYAVMNYHTSMHPTSWFTKKIVCTRMIMSDPHRRGEEGHESSGDGDEEGEIIGDLTLNGNEIRRRVNGVAETVARFEKEQDRVRGLKEWFGIILSREEREGIKNKESALS